MFSWSDKPVENVGCSVRLFVAGLALLQASLGAPRHSPITKKISISTIKNRLRVIFFFRSSSAASLVIRSVFRTSVPFRLVQKTSAPLPSAPPLRSRRHPVPGCRRRLRSAPSATPLRPRRRFPASPIDVVPATAPPPAVAGAAAPSASPIHAIRAGAPPPTCDHVTAAAADRADDIVDEGPGLPLSTS